MFKPASTPIITLKHDDSDRHTRRGSGPASVTEDPSRAAWLQQARSCRRNADPWVSELARGILVAARLALRFAEAAVVKRQRHVPSRGQAAGLQAHHLAAGRCAAARAATGAAPRVSARSSGALAWQLYVRAPSTHSMVFLAR
jgi:hypothetical protein